MFKKRELPKVEPVELKSFYGVRPGVYILVGMALFILLLAFLLFLFPGLSKDKQTVKFSTPIPLVGVYEDGKYLGNASYGVFDTTSGEHNYSFVVEGVEVAASSENIKRHVFFTLFFKRPQVITITPNYSEVLWDRIVESYSSSIVKFSAVTDYSSSYNFPPLFSNLAAYGDYFGKDVSELLLYGALNITSGTMYKDYAKAISLLGPKLQDKSLNNLDGVLSSLYDKGIVPVAEVAEANTKIEPEDFDNFYFYKEGSVTMGKNGTALSYPECNEAPQTITYGNFYISTKVVTEYDYAIFVSNNQYWAKANLEELKKDGMADDNYLSGIVLSTVLKSQKPIRNISWNAAVAFCQWMTESTGIQYRLPTEAEWTVAARSGNGKAYANTLTYAELNPTSPENMMGQLWEFTSSFYTPLGRVEGYYEKAAELSEKFNNQNVIVKGGSYVNSPSEITTETVGVVSRSTTSEFCGFRVVIDG